MEIYLIRHTTPDITKGLCYGQSDIDVTNSFTIEAETIKNIIPLTIDVVYSSPLQRCHKLSNYLYPAHNIVFADALKEIDCGEWEMQHWDDIPKIALDPWMNDFVNVPIPGGESYVILYDRVVNFFNTISNKKTSIAIVTHGGVIRSILSYITQTALINSFNAFKIHYGSVIKLTLMNNCFTYDILSNIPTEKEQHKPSKMSPS